MISPTRAFVYLPVLNLSFNFVDLIFFLSALSQRTGSIESCEKKTNQVGGKVMRCTGREYGWRVRGVCLLAKRMKNMSTHESFLRVWGASTHLPLLFFLDCRFSARFHFSMVANTDTSFPTSDYLLPSMKMNLPPNLRKETEKRDVMEDNNCV
jgi:hypothetical protein